MVAEFERAGVRPAELCSKDPRVRLAAAHRLDEASVSRSILGRLRERWFLLLQLDSEESLDLQFGDVGRLYFFITENSLASGAFHGVVGTMDCY